MSKLSDHPTTIIVGASRCRHLTADISDDTAACMRSRHPTRTLPLHCGIPSRLMSLEGQKATYAAQQRPSLFNHAVGEQLQRVGHSETEGCRGLEIDDKFVSERELNRQIAWARAPQYPVNVGRCRPH